MSAVIAIGIVASLALVGFGAYCLYMSVSITLNANRREKRETEERKSAQAK